MEAHIRDWTLFCLKRLSVIINDDFFEERECYGPELSPYISTNSKFRIALVYNQSLTTVSESRLFGSVVRALFLYRGMGIFSAMLYTCYGYSVIRPCRIHQDMRL